MSDPYTDLYNEIWKTLWAHPDLSALVADTPQSRIKFVDETGQDNPKFKTWLDQPAEADLPAVVLMTTTTVFHEAGSSSGISVTKGFSIGLHVGTYNLNAHLNPAAWYITQAMDRYTDLIALTWKDYKFVKRLRLGTSDDTIQAQGQMQENLPRGWITVWNANALLWFPHQILRGDN